MLGFVRLTDHVYLKIELLHDIRQSEVCVSSLVGKVITSECERTTKNNTTEAVDDEEVCAKDK